MELTRAQQQFVLDALAEVYGAQIGLKLTFTLNEQAETEDEQWTRPEKEVDTWNG